MAIVICPKTLNWEYMKQRPQQLMTQLGSLGHTIFFENLNPVQPQFREIEKNVFLYSDVSQLISTRLPKSRHMGPIVTWAMSTYTRSRIQLYNPHCVIYDCCDDFPQLARHQHQIVQLANHIVCSADTLVARLSLTYPDKPITLIRNGVNNYFFDNESMDKPINWPAGTVVGYVGAWSYWIDHALIRFIANRLPNVNFMVIGAHLGEVPAYDDMPNVHILGELAHQDLAKYIRNFAVGIIPFQYHPISLGTNPIKAYEYLATGIRVLSTALPECILMEPHVMTATTHQDFANKLEYLLATPDTDSNKNARIAFARQNTWSARGMQADQLIQSL